MIYDRFQQEAIDHINQGHSVIVSAPTGAGKTAIAEHVIDTAQVMVDAVVDSIARELDAKDSSRPPNPPQRERS